MEGSSLRWCPRCGTTYGPEVGVCLNDGSETMPVQPQMMAGQAWPQQWPGQVPPQMNWQQGWAPVPATPMPGWPAHTPQPVSSPPAASNVPEQYLGRMVGNYQLTRVLGTGGMGAVFLAVHPIVGNQVAVKLMLGNVAKDRELVDRFFSEARVLNQVAHENIVKFIDLGQHPEGFYYCVMEYLEGETLADVMKRGRLRLPQALRLLIQISEALGAAHARGIVHRDLKPANVMLVSRPGAAEPVAKLVDFGVAKLQEGPGAGQTVTGTIIGTPAYMSPEQAQGNVRDIDARSDLYSLGVVAYELVSGQYPFEGKSPGELLACHLVEIPKPPSRHAKLPEELDRLVLRLLDKNRENRPAEARLVAAKFRDILEKGTAAASVPPISAPARTVSSRPVTSPQLSAVRASTPAPRPATPLPVAPLRPTKSGPGTGTKVGLGLLVLVLALAGAVFSGVFSVEGAVASGATKLGLAPETSGGGFVAPQGDGTKGAFAADPRLEGCQKPFDAFRATRAPASVAELRGVLGARLDALQALHRCLEQLKPALPASSRWAVPYLEGVTTFEFARTLDALDLEQRAAARELKDSEGAARFWVEQYVGIVRDRLGSARLEAPATHLGYIERYLRELDGT